MGTVTARHLAGSVDLCVALVLIFMVALLLFVYAQIAPARFASVHGLIAHNGDARLTGILYLGLGCSRLLGGVYIHERGALRASMVTWLIGVFFILSRLAHREAELPAVFFPLLMAPLLLVWSIAVDRAMRAAEVG